ncbi:MAG TPA: NAD-dependent epimerase/dehydratase family protein [Caldithrix sp.]|nr:NAD-dependent epimerase/dehydratase family protein [Caldithrix sp.]
MAKIFLTGATGFVGSFVAEQLVKENHEVVCLVRKTSNLRWIEDLPVQTLIGSLSDPSSYEEAVKQAEVVVHVAGVTKANNAAAYYRGNVDTTRDLLQIILKTNPGLKRFLYVSSQAAVGPARSTAPMDESAVPHPITDYGKSKLTAEKLVQSFMGKLPVTIVRPPAVYGPRDTDVLHFFKGLKKGWNLQVGNVDQYVSVVYVKDLAAGIVQALFSDKSTGKLYFLCEEPPRYWSQVARLAADIMQVSYRTLRIPYRLAFGISYLLEMLSRFRSSTTILNRQKMLEIRQPFWGVSCKRAQTDFAYQTNFPLAEGIRETITWYRQNGWL